MSCRAVRLEVKGSFLWWEAFLKKWTTKQKQNDRAIEPRSGTIGQGEHLFHRNCTCEMTYPTMTEVTWENRKGCFFGSLKLWLKILMGSLQLYISFMFFCKDILSPDYVFSLVWKCQLLWQMHVVKRIPFKRLFPPLFLLLLFINWWRNCLT